MPYTKYILYVHSCDRHYAYYRMNTTHGELLLRPVSVTMTRATLGTVIRWLKIKTPDLSRVGIHAVC